MSIGAVHFQGPSYYPLEPSKQNGSDVGNGESKSTIEPASQPMTQDVLEQPQKQSFQQLFAARLAQLGKTPQTLAKQVEEIQSLVAKEKEQEGAKKELLKQLCARLAKIESRERDAAYDRISLFFDEVNGLGNVIARHNCFDKILYDSKRWDLEMAPICERLEELTDEPFLFECAKGLGAAVEVQLRVHYEVIRSVNAHPSIQHTLVQELKSLNVRFESLAEQKKLTPLVLLKEFIAARDVFAITGANLSELYPKAFRDDNYDDADDKLCRGEFEEFYQLIQKEINAFLSFEPRCTQVLESLSKIQKEIATMDAVVPTCDPSKPLAPLSKVEIALKAPEARRGRLLLQSTDGSCLYHSFAARLEQLGERRPGVVELRERTANLLTVKLNEERLMEPTARKQIMDLIRATIAEESLDNENYVKKTQTNFLKSLIDSDPKKCFILRELATVGPEICNSVLVQCLGRNIGTIVAALEKSVDQCSLKFINSFMQSVANLLLRVQINLQKQTLETEAEREQITTEVAQYRSPEAIDVLLKLDEVRVRLNNARAPQGALANFNRMNADLVAQFRSVHADIKTKLEKIVTVDFEDHGKNLELYERYISQVRTDPRCWGSYAETLMLARDLRFNIVVSQTIPGASPGEKKRQAMSGRMKLFDAEVARERTIHLDFCDGSHFNLFEDLPEHDFAFWKAQNNRIIDA